MISDSNTPLQQEDMEEMKSLYSPRRATSQVATLTSAIQDTSKQTSVTPEASSDVEQSGTLLPGEDLAVVSQLDVSISAATSWSNGENSPPVATTCGGSIPSVKSRSANIANQSSLYSQVQLPSVNSPSILDKPTTSSDITTKDFTSQHTSTETFVFGLPISTSNPFQFTPSPTLHCSLPFTSTVSPLGSQPLAAVTTSSSLDGNVHLCTGTNLNPRTDGVPTLGSAYHHHGSAGVTLNTNTLGALPPFSMTGWSSDAMVSFPITTATVTSVCPTFSSAGLSVKSVDTVMVGDLPTVTDSVQKDVSPTIFQFKHSDTSGVHTTQISYPVSQISQSTTTSTSQSGFAFTSTDKLPSVGPMVPWLSPACTSSAQTKSSIIFSMHQSPLLSLSLTDSNPALMSQTLSKDGEEVQNKTIEDVLPDNGIGSPHFKPLVSLPLIDTIKSGEEDEEAIFNHRAKLYRFDDDLWKERGIGDMKILKHKVTGKVRLLMRQDQTLKLCCNHYITTNMSLTEIKGVTQLAWCTNCDFSDSIPKPEKFAIKFKHADTAKKFRQIFEHCVMDISNIEKEVVPSVPSPCKWVCPTCFVQNENSNSQCVACGSTLSLSNETSLSRFTPTQGEWTCETCLLLNKAVDLCCVACRAPKSTLKEVTECTLENSCLPGSWICSSCSMPNFSSLDRCVGCSSLRPTLSTKVDSIVYSAPQLMSTPFKVGQQHALSLQGIRIDTLKSGSKPIPCKSGAAGMKMTTLCLPTHIVPVVSIESSNYSSVQNDQDDSLEHEPDVYFTPVVTLPNKIEMKTGEEAEEVLFCDHAKLFRFDDEVSNWKERGVGDIKILRNKDSGKSRLLMHRDQILKICCNHNISAEMNMTPMPSSSKTWIWYTPCDFADEVGKPEKFAIKFRHQDSADKFKKKFDQCATSCVVQSSPPSTFEPEIQVNPSEKVEISAMHTYDSDELVAVASELEDVVIVKVEVPSEDKIEKARQLMLPDNFFNYENKHPCRGCRGCIDQLEGRYSLCKDLVSEISSESLHSAEECIKTSSSQDVFGGAYVSSLGFADLAASQSTPFTLKSSQGSLSHKFKGTGEALFCIKHEEEIDDPEAEADIHFNSLVSLPEVAVKTGEELEEVIFSHRAKLFRFDENVSQWKERGVGDIKLLKNINTNKTRVLMRRDQILKICCNHFIAADMVLLAHQEKSWMWYTFSDFADEIPRPEKFAVRFKSSEIAQKFKVIFEDCVSGCKSDKSAIIAEETLRDKQVTKQINFQEKVASKTESWSCNVCFVSNPESVASCLACQSSRQGVEKVSMKSEGTLSDREKHGTKEPKTDSWLCMVCSSFNPNTVSSCLACQAAKQTEEKCVSPQTSPDILSNLPFCSPAQVDDNIHQAFQLPINITLPPSTTSSSCTTTTTTVSLSPRLTSPDMGIFHVPTSTLSVGEKEEVKFSAEGILYYDDVNSKIWIRKSEGIMKIIWNKVSHEKRLLMVSTDQNSVLCSHGITTMMYLRPHTEKEHSWIWNGLDNLHSTLTKSAVQKYCIEFHTEDDALKFKIYFGMSFSLPIQHKQLCVSAEDDVSDDEGGASFKEREQLHDNECQAGRHLLGIFGEANGKSDDSDDVIFVCEEIPSSDLVMKAEELLLPRSFYLYENKPPCTGCRGCIDDEAIHLSFDTHTCVVPKEAAVPESSTSTKAEDAGYFSTVGMLSFTDLMNQPENGSLPEKDLGFQFEGAGQQLFSVHSPVEKEQDDPESEADVNFQPIVSLPETYSMKSWDDDAEMLFCHRAKLFCFDEHTKQWKERGIGDMKILQHRQTMKVRLIMRRDQILKLCCNHYLTEEMRLIQLQTDRSWMWFTSSDFSHDKPQPEKLAIKFKHDDVGLEFKGIFDKCVAQLHVSDKKSIPQSSNTTLSEAFKLDTHSWVCSVCLISNNRVHRKCAACGNPNPYVDDSNQDVDNTLQCESISGIPLEAENPPSAHAHVHLLSPSPVSSQKLTTDADTHPLPQVSTQEVPELATLTQIQSGADCNTDSELDASTHPLNTEDSNGEDIKVPTIETPFSQPLPDSHPSSGPD